jgi:SAM-dependent methyltransferase
LIDGGSYATVTDIDGREQRLTDTGPRGYREYFEAPRHWGRTYGSVARGERSRIDAILGLLPSDAGAVVDVGCGDGLVTNQLLDSGFDVTGVDIAEEALRHVRAPTLVAPSENLPFADGEFDCVVASNLLEHLPRGAFEQTLAELGRVTARYLVLSVPNAEDLALAQTRCSRCKTAFHAARHVRSIGIEDIVSWFPDFHLTASRFVGDPWPYRSRGLQRLVQVIGNCWYRVPDAVCPTCGYRVDPPRPNQLVRTTHGALQRMLGRVRGSRLSQLVVLLERRTVPGS